MISRTRATVSSVWEVEGLTGRGVVFKGSASTFETGIPLKCLQSTYVGLSESCLQHFVRFSTVFLKRNRNQSTHAAALYPPSWNATITFVDVHPRASTERMRGDTDFRFCTYTCTELPHVPLCCHFATYYNFRKKTVSELNDQPTYNTCCTVQEILTWLRRLCIFGRSTLALSLSACPIDCQHMLLFSLFLWYMCRLSQMSGKTQAKLCAPWSHFSY